MPELRGFTGRNCACDVAQMAVKSATDSVDAFIARWQGRTGGQERANYQLFLTELCRTLGLDQPDPADADHEKNDYVFERAVAKHRDKGDTIGRIDLYRRNSFVLEAKQSRQKGGAKAIAGQEDLFKGDEKSRLLAARLAGDYIFLVCPCLGDFGND
jgi:hypothetical protein